MRLKLLNLILCRRLRERHQVSLFGFQERSEIRGAAFTLFGNLSQFGGGPSKDNFFEQIHTNLISFLLHLNDPDAQVRKVLAVVGKYKTINLP